MASRGGPAAGFPENPCIFSELFGLQLIISFSWARRGPGYYGQRTIDAAEHEARQHKQAFPRPASPRDAAASFPARPHQTARHIT